MQVIAQRSSSGSQTDARVLEAPLLALDPVGRSEQRLRVDRPAVDAVGGARDGEVRDPAQVLDAREEDGLAVDDRRRRVEDGVDRIRPVGRGQDRVAGMPAEELAARSRAPLPPRLAANDGRQLGGVEQERGAMEGERRLGSFVVVDVFVAEPVAAAAGREVVERAGSGGCGRGTSRTRGARRTPCSRSPVTASAASSASTNADASSGCSSPAPGAGSLAAAAAVARSAAASRRRGPTRRRASAATRGPTATSSGRPSAVPPAISACGRRALS